MVAGNAGDASSSADGLVAEIADQRRKQLCALVVCIGPISHKLEKKIMVNTTTTCFYVFFLGSSINIQFHSHVTC
jgi:hypothetical protein